MFLCEQQEEEQWTRADTYTAPTRYWLWDVTNHGLDTYQNWHCLIENRISSPGWLKICLGGPINYRNPTIVFKKRRF